MAVKARYSKNGSAKMTTEQMKKKHKAEDSDAYLFDVEYEKLKKEREEAEEEYEEAREEYLRVTEELREEMLNGTASDADMAQFMAVLTNRGVQLQEEQQQLQEQVDEMSQKFNEVEGKMEELRMKAFGGNTRAWKSASSDNDYKGFTTDSTSSYENAKVVEMTPAEYLRRVAFDVKGNGMDEVINSASPSQVEKYMRQMLRGTRFSAPSLNYKNGTSAGDARVLAAMFNGYSNIPVMVIE